MNCVNYNVATMPVAEKFGIGLEKNQLECKNDPKQLLINIPVYKSQGIKMADSMHDDYWPNSSLDYIAKQMNAAVLIAVTTLTCIGLTALCLYMHLTAIYKC